MAAGKPWSGALVIMTWTRHQFFFKNSKKGDTQLTAKYSKWEQRLVVSHTARWMTADRPGESVNWSSTPLSLSLFILSSIVQSSRGKKEEHVRPKRPEMFKAKAHTGLTQDQEQQLWTFYPAQQGAWGVCWGGCFHCRLNFYIHIYHSSSFGNKQVSKTCGEMRYNSWHLRYGTSTVLLHVNSKACERTHTHTHARKNTHTHTHVMSEEKSSWPK